MVVSSAEECKSRTFVVACLMEAIRVPSVLRRSPQKGQAAILTEPEDLDCNKEELAKRLEDRRRRRKELGLSHRRREQGLSPLGLLLDLRLKLLKALLKILIHLEEAAQRVVQFLMLLYDFLGEVVHALVNVIYFGAKDLKLVGEMGHHLAQGVVLDI
jgi:hypothetical protein